MPLLKFKTKKFVRSMMNRERLIYVIHIYIIQTIATMNEIIATQDYRS
jgi:hypothetical protein